MPETEQSKYRLMPSFDAAIIALLPEEGATMGGIYPLGKQVKQIRKELAAVISAADGNDDNARGLRSELVTTRMRALASHGYAVAVDVIPMSGGKGWQRTQSGKDFAKSNGVKA